MLSIKNTLISDALIEECFVCDLQACQGGCCADGDSGAPLAQEELAMLEEIFPAIRPWLSREGRATLEQEGLYREDKHFGPVTPSLPSGLCAYGVVGRKGIIHCAIEQAYRKEKISWPKPLSCHLFPAILSPSRHEPGLEFLNYQPRPGLCEPARRRGENQSVPAYRFLREPLMRKYGPNIIEEIDDLLSLK